MTMRCLHKLALLSVFSLAWTAAGGVEARMTLKSVCHVKGQEENTIQGMGIVVGLKGTGDSGTYLPTIRSVAKVMSLMEIPTGKSGTAGLLELKDTKNVALVIVSAIIPAAGGREGDKLDCVVSSVGSAKSLSGGRLFLTPLVGPDPRNHRVLAFADGPVTLEDPTQTTSGRIHDGCRLEEEFFNVFVKNGKITLVLEKNHADFQVAQDVVDVVNSQLRLQAASSAPMARAINQGNIEVIIPPQYSDDPVSFVSQVLALPLMEPRTGARVVVNERSGSVIISGDVEIGAVAVTHKNIVIETGGAGAGGGSAARSFVAVDPVDPSAPKLKALVEGSTQSTSPPPTSSKSSRRSIATENSTDN